MPRKATLVHLTVTVAVETRDESLPTLDKAEVESKVMEFVNTALLMDGDAYRTWPGRVIQPFTVDVLGSEDVDV